MYHLNLDKLNTKLALSQDFSTQRVLLRTCLNVTTDDTGTILDDTRLTESLPCIQALATTSKQLIITAHLGRPKEKSPSTSFGQLVKELEHRLGQPVYFATDLEQTTIERITS
jgi:3-phosphoglycerate kinase